MYELMLSGLDCLPGPGPLLSWLRAQGLRFVTANLWANAVVVNTLQMIKLVKNLSSLLKLMALFTRKITLEQTLVKFE